MGSTSKEGAHVPRVDGTTAERSRWSQEMQHFVSQLARAKAKGETNLMRRRVEQAWRHRWGSILACAVARTVASTMLELPGAGC